MRKVLAVLVFSVVCSLTAAAQDHPRGEVYGGYQFTHFDPNINANGWNASVAGNLNSWFGVKADFSGAYKNGGKFHTAMAGPVFSYRKSERVTPFAHVLVGGAWASGGGISENGFAMGVGGGLDVNLNKHVAWRLVQGDWLLFRAGGETDKKNARISTGIVFRF
ncbi:MAG TPA: outer membrane beta-barrel protein [Candidatus Acidoferrum sp.]|nr:outer membrane beta-barrel protein [Candidatus Acidoferrum sp.]